MLDDAVVSLQQKARREFTDYLAEDVGNSVATAFDFQTNSIRAHQRWHRRLEDIQQLNPLRFAYDFDGAKETWGALAETAYYANPTTAIMDPQGAFEHGKEMLPGLVHAEDWTRDRPGLGIGETSSMSGQRSPELVPREQGRGLQVPSQTQPTKPRQAFVPPL